MRRLITWIISKVIVLFWIYTPIITIICTSLYCSNLLEFLRMSWFSILSKLIPWGGMIYEIYWFILKWYFIVIYRRLLIILKFTAIYVRWNNLFWLFFILCRIRRRRWFTSRCLLSLLRKMSGILREIG